MKKNITRSLAVFFICFLYAVPASSAPVPLLNWERGEDNTTWQEWNFSQSSQMEEYDGDIVYSPAFIVNDISNDDGFNPNGEPSVSLILQGNTTGGAPGWFADYLARQGVWHSHFTQVLLTIPNYGGPNTEHKEVWVEIGLHGELMPHPNYPAFPEEEYGPKLTAYIGDTPLPTDQVIEIDRIVEVLPRIEGVSAKPWKKVTVGWRIEQNSDLEEIYFAFHNSGADIDYITVDTKIFPRGVEGCTPGYWKQKHHSDSWMTYTPDMLFSDVFDDAFPGKRLLDVLKQGGGGLKALGRHTVAALLDAASSGVDYPLGAKEVIAEFNDAYSRGDYEPLKNDLEMFNEQGCPLN